MHRRPTVIRLPLLVQRETPRRTDHPHWALFPEHRDRLTGARTGTSSYRLRATIALTGGPNASIIGLPLARKDGGIGGRGPALIG